MEDERLLRGRGLFVGDIHRPDQLHAAFVRSPYAHGRLGAIDARRALALPGVAAVFTHRDVPSGPMPPFLWDSPPPKLVAALRPQVRPGNQPLLPADKVRFVGQAVALVLAEDLYVAEDAIELVNVEYEPLPPLASIEDALAGGAPLVHDDWGDNVAVSVSVAKGDVAGALAGAAIVVNERFVVQRQAGLPIETRGAVADYDPARRELTVWSSTQNVHPLRRAIAKMLGIERDRVRVIAPDVGGGFGIKGVLYPEDVLVALASVLVGAPVKWVEDRAEHMQSAIHAREQVHEIDLGLTADGDFIALRDRFVVDNGAFNALGLVIPYNTIAHLMGPYRVPNFEAAALSVVTNKVPAAPYRGAGRPEAVFAVERAIEVAARKIGLDPVELRLRNLIPVNEMPYDSGILYRDGEPLVLDSGDYRRCLRRAADLIRYRDARLEQERARSEGRLLGIGFACYVEGTGIGPYEGATVRMDPNGSVSVYTGASAQGQGHETVLAQICADALGVDPGAISVVTGDTRGVQHGWGTVASRSAVVAGNAVALAADEVRDKMLDVAAELLEASPADLIVDGGRISVRGVPNRSVGLTEVAEAAEPELAVVDRIDSGLEATRYFRPPTVTWANGMHAVLVEIERETGIVRLLLYAVVHDCGTVINPQIVEGQIHGGVAQGIGGALLEELLYDDQGQLLTITLADYLLPTVLDIPPLAVEHVESPSPLNELGLKGVGEGGAVAPPAAIANAVEDALSLLDIPIRRTPLTPSHVRSLIEEAEAVDRAPAASIPAVE